MIQQTCLTLRSLLDKYVEKGIFLMSVFCGDRFLQMLIAEVPFCALDFETTQLPEASHEFAIIEVGAQRFIDNKLDSIAFQTLVNPKCSIRQFDTGVSGITDEMVISKPTFPDISEDFFSYINDHVILAHNATFEQRVLKSQCSRDGLAVPKNLYIDTAALLRKAVKLSSYTLESASQYFGIDRINAHRAGGDCELLVKVFRAIRVLLETKYGLRYFRDLCTMLQINIDIGFTQKNLFD